MYTNNFVLAHVHIQQFIIFLGWATLIEGLRSAAKMYAIASYAWRTFDGPIINSETCSARPELVIFLLATLVATALYLRVKI